MMLCLDTVDTSQVQWSTKNGISIYYDTTERLCTLKIDNLTDDNKGNYSCSVMIPYPDDDRILKLNSTFINLTPIPFNHPKNNDKIILGTTTPIIVVTAICCWKKPWMIEH